MADGITSPQPASTGPHPTKGPKKDAFREGVAIERPDPATLAAALEAAFDYRGDVTIELEGGEIVTGYIFNRVAAPDGGFLEMFPSQQDTRRRIAYGDIVALRFSGKDTASGRSWETWVRHYNEKKAARARGENVGSIGLSAIPFDEE